MLQLEAVMLLQISLFYHNHARYSRGCMHIKNESIVGVNNGTFSNNTAENDGGVMILFANSIAHINSSIFTRNEARGRGGVISLQKSSVNIHYSTFNLSIAGNSEETVYAWNTSFKIGSTITDCVVKIGGVLHLDNNSNGSIAQSNFTRNRADNCGGVCRGIFLIKSFCC